MSDIKDRLLAACNGHPTAAIPWPHRLLHDAIDQIEAQQARIAELEDSVRFFAIRCEELQEIQSRMRDPERQMVCDILANGKPRDKAGIGEYKALLGGGRDI